MELKHLVNQVTQIRSIHDDEEDKDKRIIEFVISDETKDRHRTVVPMDGWQLDNFNRNGIVGYQHNIYGDHMCVEDNPDNVIGKATAFIENRQLIGRVEFESIKTTGNELAEKIQKKVEFGSLRATSVGFAPVGEGKFGEGDQARGESDETFFFEGAELLEFSIVNIPSNPNALKRFIGSMDMHERIRKLPELLKATPEELLKFLEDNYSTWNNREIPLSGAYTINGEQITHLIKGEQMDTFRLFDEGGLSVWVPTTNKKLEQSAPKTQNLDYVKQKMQELEIS